MSGWTKDSEEVFPLRGKETNQPDTPRKHLVAKDADDAAFVPPSTGLVFSAYSRESANDPYKAQSPYNPSYRPIEDTMVPEVIGERNHSVEAKEAKENETPENNSEDNFVTYCIIVVLVTIAIAVICGVVYLVIKHPKLANALHNIAIEVRKPHEEEEETPLFKKIFNPVIAHEAVKALNDSRS